MRASLLSLFFFLHVVTDAKSADAPGFIGDAQKGAFFVAPFYVNLDDVVGIEFDQNTLVVCEDIICSKENATYHALGVVSVESESAAVSFLTANWFRFFDNGETDRFINPSKLHFNHCQIVPGKIQVFPTYLGNFWVDVVDNQTDRYLCLNRLAPTPPHQ